MQNSTKRTWDSTCGDCAHCSDGTCRVQHTTTGSEDCIAAICTDFQAKTAQRDA